MQLDQKFWNDRYVNNETGWDLGAVSPPLKAYIDQIKNKELKILIPGAGNAYEAEYLWKNGFKNSFVVDISELAIQNFLTRIPEFPSTQAINLDFFKLKENFDLILEQTFFCALHPNMRTLYVKQMHTLLANNGLLVGLLFKIPLNEDHPPFGGNKKEYIGHFSPYFDIEIMKESYNSIPPRQGNELFIKLRNQLKSN